MVIVSGAGGLWVVVCVEKWRWIEVGGGGGWLVVVGDDGWWWWG